MKFTTGCILTIIGFLGFAGDAQALRDQTVPGLGELAEMAGCAALDEQLNLSVPCLSVEGSSSDYDLTLKMVNFTEYPGGLYWELDSQQINAGDDSSPLICATTDKSLNITIPCIKFIDDEYTLYQAELSRSFDPSEPFSADHFWELAPANDYTVWVCDLPGGSEFCNNETTCIEQRGYWWQDETCNSTDRKVKDTETEIIDVTSLTNQVWMDRNLGASQVATKYFDSEAYGDLYQWGREADGHEKRDSLNTSNVSYTDNPAHSFFITRSASPWDWRFTPNSNLWQGEHSENNPCPAGYRIPTDPEWELERVSFGDESQNVIGAYESKLKLVAAGYRRASDGEILYENSVSRYWSSTVDGNFSRMISAENWIIIMSPQNRANGYSVRCIKD